jgi:hypothetical protein
MHHYDDSTDLTEDDVRRIWREEMRAGRETETTPPDPEPKSGPPTTAPKLDVSTHELTMQILVESTGSHEKAIEQLAADPAVLATLEPKAKERRSQLEAQALENAVEEWKQSPDGRQYLADEALKAQENRSRLVTASRALLETSHPELDHGLISRMSDDEILEYAGVLAAEPDPTHHEAPPKSENDIGRDRLEQQFWTMAEPQRRAAAAELGMSEDELEEMRARKLASPNLY